MLLVRRGTGYQHVPGHAHPLHSFGVDLQILMFLMLGIGFGGPQKWPSHPPFSKNKLVLTRLCCGMLYPKS